MPSPPDTGNLLGWWKADGTLWQHNDGTTAVSADGDLIGRWEDASGNGKHMEVADANRPTFKTSIQNSLPVVRMAGKFLNTNSHTIAIPQAFTLYLVSKQTGDATREAICGSDAFEQGTQVFQHNTTMSGGAGTMRFQRYGGSNPLVDAGSLGTSAFKLIVLWTDATGIESFINDVSQGTAAYGGTPATATQGVSLGGNGFVGSTGTNTDFGEALFYGVAHDAATRKSAESYLNTKWGLGIAGLGSGGGANKGGGAHAHSPGGSSGGGKGKHKAEVGGAAAYLILPPL